MQKAIKVILYHLTLFLMNDTEVDKGYSFANCAAHIASVTQQGRAQSTAFLNNNLSLTYTERKRKYALWLIVTYYSSATA